MALKKKNTNKSTNEMSFKCPLNRIDLIENEKFFKFWFVFPSFDLTAARTRPRRFVFNLTKLGFSCEVLK